MRNIICEKLIKGGMPINLTNLIISKMNLLINPLFLQIAPKELEKVLNTFCVNLYLYRKKLLKKFGTDTRFISIAPAQSLVLLKLENGDPTNQINEENDEDDE